MARRPTAAGSGAVPPGTGATPAGTPVAPVRQARPRLRRGPARPIPGHVPDAACAGPVGSAALARADRDRPSEEAVDAAAAERQAKHDPGVVQTVREGIESARERTGDDEDPLPSSP
ncbi:hypothetical protein ACPOLB_00825 [Rubrivivax sp. RP6-9]|uniref:hypothetical protein n=1 Tax=Rubrivivax sp. RP6-9 TaxID=3415750 RepID=UPI003CC57B9F